MILKIIYYGHPVLRKKAMPVAAITDEIKQLANDLVETMHNTKNGIGLAAPQVGKSISLFVVQFPSKEPKEEDAYTPGPIEFFINPKILEISAETCFYSEGCLSIPGLHRDVERPFKIKIQYQNLSGETLVQEFEDFEARMILHENDHLNGVLFIDRLNPKIRKSIASQLCLIKKKFT